MKVLYASTLALSGSHFATIGQVLPIFMKLEIAFKVKDDDSTSIKAIKEKVWNSLKGRYEASISDLCVAWVLDVKDPRFLASFIRCTPNLSVKISVKKCVLYTRNYGKTKSGFENPTYECPRTDFRSQSPNYKND